MDPVVLGRGLGIGLPSRGEALPPPKMEGFGFRQGGIRSGSEA